MNCLWLVSGAYNLLDVKKDRDKDLKASEGKESLRWAGGKDKKHVVIKHNKYRSETSLQRKRAEHATQQRAAISLKMNLIFKCVLDVN